MSNYVQTTFFAPKDALLSGNPAKIIYGAQVDPELAAIATAIATKYDSSSIASAPVLFAAGAANLPSIAFTGGTNNNTGIYLAAANSLGFAANGVAAGSILSTGGWVIPAATADVTFTLTGAATKKALKVIGSSTSGQSYGIYCSAGTTAADIAFEIDNQSAGSVFMYIQGDGQAFVAAPTTFNSGVAGTFQIGYLDTPPNGQAGAYQFVLSDRGKQVQHQSASAHTWTIPANASVAFPVGTTIVLASTAGAGVITLAITSDTLTWAPSGASGSRTLTAPFLATITKISATLWYITGAGIT